MKFTKIVLLSAFGVVLATVQMSSSSETVESEQETRTAEDAYANYQQYYQQYAHQPAHQPIVKPFGLQNKQDFTSDIKEVLGEDAGLYLGLVGSLIGVVSLVGLVVNAQSTASICTTAKAVGETNLATVSATTEVDSDAERMAKFNLIINKINGYATPSC